MLIGVDVDGVLADLIGAIQQWADVYDPANGFKYAEANSWSFLKQRWPGDKTLRGFRSIIDEVWEDWSTYMQPMEQCLPASLKRLYKSPRKHKIAIFTTEPRRNHRSMLAWLEHHKIPYDEVIMSGMSGTKLEYPVDVMIDDNPVLVEDALNYPRKTVLLRDQPWNRDVGELPPNVVRVGSLLEAVNVILGQE